ncbi:MAG: hypothetical protein V4598_07545 [Bdellovibrionota bacterium]
MKSILSVIFLFVSLSASASVEESCCFCVADPSDASTTAECGRWLKDHSKKLSCTKNVIFPSHNNISFEADLSCRKVTAYGANHGLSYYYSTVFQFAAKAAKAVRPVELSYDGSTCLVFNNIELVESEAKKLSTRYPDVKFVLSGNQNTGVVRYIKLPIIGSRPKEINSMASKMTVTAQGGTTEVEYGECSRPKGTCGYAKQDMGATNDSNSKLCVRDNEIVEQKCCSPKKGDFGKWGVPGLECEV